MHGHAADFCAHLAVCTYVCMYKACAASFEDKRSIKCVSPLILAPLIFQMINDGLTKQALDKC